MDAEDIFKWGEDEAWEWYWHEPRGQAPYAWQTFAQGEFGSMFNRSGVIQMWQMDQRQATENALAGIPWSNARQAGAIACQAVGHEPDEDNDYCYRCAEFLD